MTTPHSPTYSQRFDRATPSLKNWGELPPRTRDGQKLPADVVLECGWGRLIFGHTFRDRGQLADMLQHERPGKRDICLYLRDPHVLLSLAPQALFLDPSHTYRLWLAEYRPAKRSRTPAGFSIKRIQTRREVAAMNRILSTRSMVPIDDDFVWAHRKSRELTYLVAKEKKGGRVIGSVTGVDHSHAFGDPENGSSLWCLAVDPQAALPGVGEALVRHLAEHYAARGRAFMDLSVMHDNNQAIALYDKLGFRRVPVFCVKNKNAINERLYAGPEVEPGLNPYAMIIINEARRRGITVDVLDRQAAYFRLGFGGRQITCRESLSELTTAVAMSRCGDKRVTHRVLEAAGLRVPAQQNAGDAAGCAAFLERHHRVVVKPARGEQGAGITVDVRDAAEIERAVERARTCGSDVILEEMVDGLDLRVVVIGEEAVAAAVRKPAEIIGTGRHRIEALIAKQSRRRQAATQGESHIPVDEQTDELVRAAGYAMDSILPAGERLLVRKTANLHTGGTIRDVSQQLHPELAKVAVRAAQALEIPVVGLDLMVAAVDGPDYVIIEANERPGLANHEPQPTAERFVDLLFPQTASPRRPKVPRAPAARETPRPADAP